MVRQMSLWSTYLESIERDIPTLYETRDPISFDPRKMFIFSRSLNFDYPGIMKVMDRHPEFTLRVRDAQVHTDILKAKYGRWSCVGGFEEQFRERDKMSRPDFLLQKMHDLPDDKFPDYDYADLVRLNDGKPPMSNADFREWHKKEQRRMARAERLADIEYELKKRVAPLRYKARELKRRLSWSGGERW